MRETNHLWTIVLAAGEGSRLRSLSRDSQGEPLPKQYWPIHGRRTMLDWTIERAARLTSHLRIVAVVAEHHRRWWEGALRAIPPWNILVQPESRGTAIGILFPVLDIASYDPGATVVILPTDHYVERESVLRTALEGAIDAVAAEPLSPILLGMTPTAPDPDLGYIIPGAGTAMPAPVERFIEKPGEATARQFIAEGALWNTFVMVARAGALLHLFDLTHPSVLAAFRKWFEEGRATEDSVRALYAGLPEVDFCRDILQRVPSAMRVMAVPGCGWTDLGTPARLGTWRASRAAPRPVSTAQPHVRS